MECRPAVDLYLQCFQAEILSAIGFSAVKSSWVLVLASRAPWTCRTTVVANNRLYTVIVAWYGCVCAQHRQLTVHRRIFYETVVGLFRRASSRSRPDYEPCNVASASTPFRCGGKLIAAQTGTIKKVPWSVHVGRSSKSLYDPQIWKAVLKQIAVLYHDCSYSLHQALMHWNSKHLDWRRWKSALWKKAASSPTCISTSY